MARHGENIRKRKDGRWEGRYPVYSEEKGKCIYHSIYGKTYEEARNKLTIQKNNLRNIQKWTPESVQPVSLYKPSDILFSDTAEKWLSEVKKIRKLSTYVKYELIYRDYLKVSFGNAALSEVTNEFVKEKIPVLLSYSMQRSIYCVLNQILKFASRHYSITIPTLKNNLSYVSRKPIEVLTKREQEKLLEELYCKMDIFKIVILLCLFTGLRLGELCALKWEDIDLKNQILMVKRTVQRIYVEGSKTKTILLVTEPKSESSRREIPLSDRIFKYLLQLQNEKEYIFGGNKPMEPRTLQYHFKKILKEADLADKNFHILRHTFATNCIEGGTDVKSLSEMLGHSDVQITLNKYVHPTMDTKRRHLDELSSFYGQICGQVG